MTMDAATAETILNNLPEKSLQLAIAGVNDYYRVTTEIANAISGLDQYIEAADNREVSDVPELHLKTIKENMFEFANVFRKYEDIPEDVREAIDVTWGAAAAAAEDDGEQRRPLRQICQNIVIGESGGDDKSPDGSSDTLALGSYGRRRTFRRNSTGSPSILASEYAVSEYGGIGKSVHRDDLAGIAGHDELDDVIDNLDGMSKDKLKGMLRYHILENCRLKAECAANWTGNNDSPTRTPDSLRPIWNISNTEDSWGSWANGNTSPEKRHRRGGVCTGTMMARLTITTRRPVTHSGFGLLRRGRRKRQRP